MHPTAGNPLRHGLSCIGASVIGGICNNSGGALVRRGPAFTQMALYAPLDGNGRLHLINHIGIRLGDEPEQMRPRDRLADTAALQHVTMHGRDMFLSIHYLGTGHLPALFKLKRTLDAFLARLGMSVVAPSDRLLQFLSLLWRCTCRGGC